MKTAKLNDYQKRALKRFEASYTALIDAGVGLIAHQQGESNIGLYAYSFEDMAEPITMETAACEDYLDEGYECITDDLEEVDFFDVEDIMFETGYQPYAKFKEEE